MAIGEIIGITKEVIGLFTGPQPTPEQQKQKAGVWYNMLMDWSKNQPDTNTFITRWQSRLPFKQNSTKDRFMINNIAGRSFESVQDVLVDKINDELIKGGLQTVGKDAILSGMNATGNALSSAVSPTSGGVTSIPDFSQPGMDKNNSMFIVWGLAAIGLAVGLWNVFKK